MRSKKLILSIFHYIIYSTVNYINVISTVNKNVIISHFTIRLEDFDTCYI